MGTVKTTLSVLLLKNVEAQVCEIGNDRIILFIILSQKLKRNKFIL